MKHIAIIVAILLTLSAKAQFTGTDSLRNYNNRYITNNPATSFTNLRLNTLLRGIIDWVDTARAGTGGGGALGVDTLWELNDSTVRYRKNGVFRNMILRGVYDTRRKVDTVYKVNDTTIGFTINHTARTIVIPGRGTFVDSIYRKSGQDSIYYRIAGVERAIKDSSGTAVTLSNIGSGYRWVKTSDGQIKTSFAGYGIIKDSTTNTDGITDKADTSSTNHLVTQSDLNDVSALKLNISDTTNKWINDIRRSNDSVYVFKNGSWQFKFKDSVGGGGSSLSAGIQTGITNSQINYDPRINSNLIFNDFLLTTIGPKWDASNATNTTITFSAGHMRLVGGNAADYIYDSVQTIVHRWTEEVRAVIQSVGGSDYFSFGIQSQGTQSILFTIKASDLSGTAKYNNGTVTLGTTAAQGTTSVGDSVIFRIRRDNFILYFDVVNVTQSTSQTLTYNYANIDAVAGTVNPFREFAITLNPIAGTIDIDYAKLYNQERLYADYIIIGHSIAEGFNAGPPDSTFYNRLQNHFPDKRFSLYARSASKASDFISAATKEDMLALRAKRALIMLGVNEIQASVSIATFIADMRALVDTLENHGTQVIVCTTTPYNAANKAAIIAYNAALLTEFRTQLINIYDTLEVNGLMQSSNDSLHPDGQGHRYMFNVLKDEITRLTNIAYDPEGIIRIFPRGIESGRSMAGIQSNFGLIPLNLGNSGTSYPGIGYNVNFQATNDYKYKESDYANLIQFGASGGKMSFKVAPSGTLGDPITFTDAMTIIPSGDIGMGEITPRVPLHIKRSQSGKTTLAESIMLSLDNSSGGTGQRQEIGMGYWNGNAYPPIIIGNVVSSNTDFTKSHLYFMTRGVTTNTAPEVRLLIEDSGYVQLYKASIGAASDSAWTWNRTNNRLEYSKINIGTPVTSLNSQTGAVTITAGAGITTSTLSGDITVAVDVNNSVLPHTIATYFTDAANTGTGETDLYSTTTGANTLSSNGQTLYFDYTVNVSDVTATVDLVVYFAGTAIGNTGALTVSSTGTWRVTGSITRATSTTARSTVAVTSPGASATSYVNETDLTSQNFATTNIVKITGQAGGAGGGTGDITAKMGKLYYQP